MALTKECACWGCHKQATLPSDIVTQEDVESAIIICDDCNAAGCDEWETGVPCIADHAQHKGHVDGCDTCEDARDAEDDASAERECPTCGAERPRELGRLGSRRHFRCRNCGQDFSITA